MIRKFVAAAAMAFGLVSVVGAQAASARPPVVDQVEASHAHLISDDWESRVIRLYNSWQECLAGMEAYGPTTTTCIPVDGAGVTALVGKPTPTA